MDYYIRSLGEAGPAVKDYFLWYTDDAARAARSLTAAFIPTGILITLN